MKNKELLTIRDQIVITASENMFGSQKHEVFNSKSPNYLNFEHFIEDAEDTSNPKGLLVTSKITHGLIVNKNNRMYLPSKLKDAIPSVTEPSNVPVKIKHAARKEEPLGRALGAQWVDTSTNYRNTNINIQDAYNHNPQSPALLRMIKDLNQKGLLRKGNPDWRGAGFLLADALITDPDAIDKILTKRLLTVSIEMTADDAFNSITGESYIFSEEDQPEPGIMVEDEYSFIVYGGLKIDGWAYETHPADIFAQDISVVKLSDRETINLTKEIGSKAIIHDGCVDKRLIEDSILYQKKEEKMNLKELINKLVTAELAGSRLTDVKEIEDKLEVKHPEGLDLDAVPSLFNLGGLKVTSLEVLDKIEAEVDNADIKMRLGSLRLALEDNLLVPKTVEVPKDVLEVEDSELENVWKSLKDRFVAKGLIPEKLEVSVQEIEDAKKEAEAAKAEKAEIELQIEDALGKVAIYKEQAKELIEDAYVSKGATNKAIESAKEAYVFVCLKAQELLDKEFNLEDSKKELDELSVTELTEKAQELWDSLSSDSWDKVKQVLFEGTREAGSEKIDNPLETNDNINNESEPKKVSFSKKDIRIAKSWKEIFDNDGEKEANAYLTRMRNGGSIAKAFDPESILETIKEEDK